MSESTLYTVSKEQMIERAKNFVHSNYPINLNSTDESKDKHCERLGLILWFVTNEFPND